MGDVQGVYAAALTPRGKNGEIDFGSAFELIDFLCKGGVSGIALCASAGEFAALRPEERSRLVYLSLKRSRLPVLAGVGSATLDSSIALAREARDAGAAGLLLPPPFFFPYDQNDLEEFYSQFARQLGGGIPIYLSHLPPTGARLETRTALDLLSSGKFAGIESADGLLEASAGQPWRVLASDDATWARTRCSGAPAGISVAACAVPELMSALDRALASNDQVRAAELDGRLADFLRWAEQFPATVAVRAAAAVRGISSGPAAVPLSPEKQRKLQQFLAWFKDWLR